MALTTDNAAAAALCLSLTAIGRAFAEWALDARFGAGFRRLAPRHRALAVKNALKGAVLMACVPLASVALDLRYRQGVADADNPFLGLVAAAYAAQDATALATCFGWLAPRTRAHHCVVCVLWVLFATSRLRGPFAAAVWLCAAATTTGVVNVYLALRKLLPPGERRSMASACFWLYASVFAATVVHQTLLLRASDGGPAAACLWAAFLAVVWIDDVYLLRHLFVARRAREPASRAQ